MSAIAASAAGRSLRRPAGVVTLMALAVLLLVMIVIAIGSGATWMAPGKVLGVLLDLIGIPVDGVQPRDRAVVLGIRLPRVVLGICVGAGLAISGTLMQGLFRNPLADPGLIGVSSGAAVGAAGSIVFGTHIVFALGLGAAFLPWVTPVSAFVGGLLATILIHQLARREGETEIATMLLAGVAVSAICFAGIGYLSFLSDDRQLRDITFWTLGSLGGASWQSVLAMTVFLIPALLTAPLLARTLNALILGEREAGHLGIHVERDKRLAIGVSALAVGASVAASGVIGFVGLIVPHLVRLLVGADNRVVMPGAALLGASLMLAADLAARTMVAPAELPIGVVMSALGGPFFLWLLRRKRVDAAMTDILSNVMANASSLQAREVTVRAGGRNLIEAISIDVVPGQMLAVIGANGAGKSTLLRALAGETKVSHGAVQLDGQTLKAIGPAKLARRRAVLPQETRLAFFLKVDQVVALGRLPHRAVSDRQLDNAAVARALASVDLEGFAERQYATLSGGERQRVNLARVLAQLDSAGEDAVLPRYLLLDEPTAALDLKHQSTLMSLLRRQTDAGIGILAVLHDLNQALGADRVLVLRGGKMLALGTPEDVLTRDTIRAAFDVEAQTITLPDGRRYLATG